MAESVVAPVVADATRTPSTRTSVCWLLAPRRNTPDTDPGPPFWTISVPGCRCRSSARLCTPDRAISSRPMTVTSASSSVVGCNPRVAVTETGSSRWGLGGAATCARPEPRWKAATHANTNDENARSALKQPGETDIEALRVDRATPHGSANTRRGEGRCEARRRAPADRTCERFAIRDHRNATRIACRPRFRGTSTRHETGRRPVSGLASLDRPPSRRRASQEACRQWRMGRSALAHRCGGSRGLARDRPARHRIPVSPAARDSRRTPASFHSTAAAGRLERRADRPSPRLRPGAAPCYNPRPFNELGSRPHEATSRGPLRDAKALHPHLRLPDERVRLGQDGRRARSLRRPHADRTSRGRRRHPVQHLLGAREGAGARVPRSGPRARAEGGSAGPHHRRRRLRREPGRRGDRRARALRRCRVRPADAAPSAGAHPRAPRHRQAAGRHRAFPRSRSSTTCRRRASTDRRRSCRSWRAAASTARSASCRTRAARKCRGRSTTC